MTINTNPGATAAALHLQHSHEMLNKSLNRLSSGSKIVLPSDDAAGLAVSEKLDAENRRLGAAGTNVQNAYPHNYKQLRVAHAALYPFSRLL